MLYCSVDVPLTFSIPMTMGRGAAQQNGVDTGPQAAGPAFLFVGEGETALSLRVFQTVETAANKA